MTRIFTLLPALLLLPLLGHGQCDEGAERRVLLVGDSWAFFMGVDQTINTVLERWGHSNYRYHTNLVLAENGAETDDFLTATKQNEIAAQLASNPTIDVVHLSIGGNDVLGDWNVNFTPAMTDSLKASVFDRLVEIIEFIKDARPDIHILWSGYMYPNFEEVIESFSPISTLHPFYGTWEDMGFPSFLQLNSILNDFSETIEAYAATDPQVSFVKATGLMQYTFGQDTPLGVAPGGSYPAYTQPLPFGDPTYPSPRNSMRDYLLTKDCFHLSASGYRDMIAYHTQKFYHKFLMNDQYFLSEGGDRDGSVSSTGQVSPELKVGGINGEGFVSILSFNTSGMEGASVEAADLFLRREILEGTNPISSSMLLKVRNGYFGGLAEVDVEDHTAIGQAAGQPCQFGDRDGNGRWIRLRVPENMLPFITADGLTQFVLSAPGVTDGVVTFTGAADPEFAPVLNVSYGLSTETTDVMPTSRAATPSLFPNPTVGPLTVDTDGALLVSLEVLDVAGRQHARSTDPSGRLDLSSLPPGSYLVRVTTDQGVTTHRVVKW